jgi:hypothetical protein
MPTDDAMVVAKYWASRGGAVSPSESPIVASALRLMAHIVEDAHHDPGLFRPLPEIRWAVTRSERLNAFAQIEGGVAGVGITLAASTLIADLFARFMAHPAVVPTVGNAEAEEREIHWYAPLTDSLTDWSLARSEIPGRSESGQSLVRDPTRAAFGAKLAGFACEYLVRHELAHLIHGHVQYLVGARSQAALLEVGFVSASEIDEARLLTWRACEMDADATAISIILNRRFGRLPEEAIRQDDGRCDNIALPSTLIFALSALYRLQYVGSVGGGRHPLTRWRQLATVQIAAEFFFRRTPAELHASISTHFLAAMVLAEQACATIAPAALPGEGFQDYTWDGHLDYLGPLAQEWERIRPSLVPFAWRPLGSQAEIRRALSEQTEKERVAQSNAPVPGRVTPP